MNDLNDRLNEIAKHFNLKSYSEFTKKTGLSHQTVSNYLKRKRLDAKKLAIIKQTFS